MMPAEVVKTMNLQRIKRDKKHYQAIQDEAALWIHFAEGRCLDDSALHHWHLQDLNVNTKQWKWIICDKCRQNQPLGGQEDNSITNNEQKLNQTWLWMVDQRRFLLMVDLSAKWPKANIMLLSVKIKEKKENVQVHNPIFLNIKHVFFLFRASKCITQKIEAYSFFAVCLVRCLMCKTVFLSAELKFYWYILYL